MVAIRSSHHAWRLNSFSQSPMVGGEERGLGVGRRAGEVEELVDGRRPILRGQRRDLRRRAAESGSAEQVCDVGRLWHARLSPVESIPPRRDNRRNRFGP